VNCVYTVYKALSVLKHLFEQFDLLHGASTWSVQYPINMLHILQGMFQ